MARITVEDCLRNVENRFALVMLAVKRSKQLYAGADPVIGCDNKEVITSLREIAAKKVNPIDAKLDEKKGEQEKFVPITLKDPDDY